MRRRGATIVEVMIAAVLLLYAVLVFLTIYSTTVRYEVHSQNRVLAAVLGENLLDEMESHPYGVAAPDDWKVEKSATGDWAETSIPVLVSGRQVMAVFHTQMQFRNGSFVGLAKDRQSWDVFTGIISWREGNLARVADDYPKGYFKDDNQHLIVQIPVWR